jgi:hypothetical protein
MDDVSITLSVAGDEGMIAVQVGQAIKPAAPAAESEVTPNSQGNVKCASCTKTMQARVVFFSAFRSLEMFGWRRGKRETDLDIK